MKTPAGSSGHGRTCPFTYPVRSEVPYLFRLRDYILDHTGLEPVNLFHAMEVLYHCANGPYI